MDIVAIAIASQSIATVAARNLEAAEKAQAKASRILVAAIEADCTKAIPACEADLERAHDSVLLCTSSLDTAAKAARSLTRAAFAVANKRQKAKINKAINAALAAK